MPSPGLEMALRTKVSSCVTFRAALTSRLIVDDFGAAAFSAISTR
jgi:hypothetical protein